MTARDVSSRLLLVVGLIAVGCYDVPKPDCGFRCGPNTACPDGYTCASDGRCHRDGSDPGLSCPTPDGGPTFSPRVVTSFPSPGATVDRMTVLGVSFDVDVSGVTEASFRVLVRSTQQPLAAFVDYRAESASATLTVPGGMPKNEQLDMVLTEDIIDAVSTRALRPTTIPFSTGDDTTGPKVVFVDPPADAIASVDTDVVLRFDEAITGVNAANITLSAGGPPLAADISSQTAQRFVTIDPVLQLAANTTHTVSVANIFDESGNPIVPFTATFTTGDDFVRPRVLGSVPDLGATNVPVDTTITVTFDEPVLNVSTTTFQLNNGAIAGTVTMSNQDRTATFAPTADLPAGSTITILLGSGITDAAGNPLFTTVLDFATQ